MAKTENSRHLRKISDLKEMLAGSAGLFDKNPAFYTKDQKNGKYKPITYRKFKKDVDCLGTKLIDMGLCGEKIALVGENCYQWITAYLSVVNGTGIVVPLDKELSRDEMLLQLRAADCAAVFYTDTFASYFTDTNIRYKINMSPESDSSLFNYEINMADEQLRFDELLSDGAACMDSGDRRFLDAKIDPDAFSILLFTSGTTDFSKGVMLSHRNVCTSIMGGARIVNATSQDRFLSILPIHHTLECTVGVLSPLYLGASVAFCEGLKYIAKNIVQIKATIILGVPLIFESLYKKIWKQIEKQGKGASVKKAAALNRRLKSVNSHFDISRRIFKDIHDKFGGKLRMMISGAAAIDPKVCRGFEDLGFQFIQGYGLTECAPLVAGTPYYINTYKKAGSIGLPAYMVDVKISEPNEDGIGELLCRGPNVMLGYYNDPQRTASVMEDGWFHTGDLALIDKENCIYITGRQKDVIVTKTGKNIYPEEVEFYINRSEYIAESLVYGVYSDREDDIVVTVSVFPDYENIYERFGDNVSSEQVHQIVKDVVGAYNASAAVYKRIRGFTVRKKEFEKTTTKKIKRNAKENLGPV